MSQKGLAPILIVLLIAVIGGYLIYQNQSAAKPYRPFPSAAPEIKPSSSPADASGAPTGAAETANWKTYTNTAIGIEFKLPSNLVNKSDFKQEIVTGPANVSAQTGSTVCIRFSKKKISLIKVAYAGGYGCFPEDSDLLLIASTSKDFGAPRSGTFVELQGFKIDSNKYYLKINLDRTEVIASELVQVVNNPNNVAILKVSGSDNPNSPANKIWNTLGKGDIGALINTNNTNYPGIAMQAKLSDIDDATFTKILATFKFIQ